MSLTFNTREYILDRYEVDEILDILNIDVDTLIDLLEERIEDNIEKFDVPPNYEE